MHTIGPNYILFSNILATAFILLFLFCFFFKTGSLYLDKHAYFLGIPVYTPSEKISAQVEYSRRRLVSQIRSRSVVTLMAAKMTAER